MPGDDQLVGVKEGNKKIITKTCKICGHTYLGRKGARYCSVECREEGIKRRSKWYCIICGEKIVTTQKKNTCSKECHKKWIDRTITIGICKKCGREFSFRIHDNKKYCSKYCSNHDSNRNMYKREGIIKSMKCGFLRLDIDRQQKLKDLASKQQSFPNYEMKKECEVCGNKKSIIVHHISYSPIIIITICRSCHHYLHVALLEWKNVHPRINGRNV